MKEKIIGYVVSYLLNYFLEEISTPENLTKAIDAGLKALEKVAAKTDNAVDDKIVADFAETLRGLCGIN